MKIAILTSGILPVPAVKGGAVENLIDFYLEYNDRHGLHDITVYSVGDRATSGHPALLSAVNHYRYIDISSPMAKLRKKWFQLTRRQGYYHYTIMYFLSQALRQIRKERFDLILLENRVGFALQLSGVVRTPLVYHLHNDFLNTSTPHGSELCRASAAIICISGFIAKRVEAIGVCGTVCKTVFNAIDTGRFSRAAALPRTTLGLREDDFVVVYSGRLIPEKGILQLIQALQRLDDIPQLKLLIIGASAYGRDKEPSPFVQQLEAAAEAVRDKVVFTGFVDYSDIPSYLKMADLAVVPSLWEEPFGLTVIEAMAASLPLVTTRSGGIPEVCEGVATIIDKDDSLVAKLADAILDIYRHPEKRRQMGEAASERSKQFDKDTYARNFLEALTATSR